MNNNLEQATLAGGCYWCTEAVFQNLKGVEKVVSGFSGDTQEKADYYAVASGQTKHAEAIQIDFDPTVISFETLLKVHLTTHNPTTLNKQGADTGPQYRSAIFYHNETQLKTAKSVIAEIQAALDSPVVTTLEPYEAFYAADDEHQNFYRDNPESLYCQAVIIPKMKKFHDQWSAYLK
ncbi:peptide-methionine (S)-S-oxide reductase MsrA [bacterium]|nr:peptide-methionine (S)-S-oxide reductase MsrA [bacterium]NCQ55137.1 peptide-methionine (S)-S-oxide reductase MsrA [Candidatus Parcubacteria bacterium]NCS67350.1 peptide-methionine (S)-S-oxide reductase MsrA [Candidatus Peregrinibacteria bacterium]NCS96605.1 peptide-methionine (S)-S-oxide reductase MsrA [bacterium]